VSPTVQRTDPAGAERRGIPRLDNGIAADPYPAPPPSATDLERSRRVIRLVAKPPTAMLAALAGLVAGKVFDSIWARLGRGEHPPEADDKNAGWAAVLGGALLQGAVYAAVQAAVKRGSATAVEKATGTWPGPTEAAAG
jgi:hypothetical protein